MQRRIVVLFVRGFTRFFFIYDLFFQHSSKNNKRLVAIADVFMVLGRPSTIKCHCEHDLIRLTTLMQGKVKLKCNVWKTMGLIQFVFIYLNFQ